MARHTPEFIIHRLDGSWETVQMLPRHQVAYEMKEKKSLSDVSGVTDLYKMAYYALGYEGPFTDFLDTLAGVESTNDDEGVADSTPLPDTDE